MLGLPEAAVEKRQNGARSVAALRGLFKYEWISAFVPSLLAGKIICKYCF